MATRILCLRPHASTTLDWRAQLITIAEELSPRIGWVEGLSVPCLCCDVGATAAWFGGEAALVERLQPWIDRQPLPIVSAIADTVGATWAVVHFGATSRRRSRSLPCVIVHDLNAALQPLPIAALRVSPASVLLLRELGIHTIDQLQALPRAEVMERLDQEVLYRLDQALGTRPEVIAPYCAPPQWMASHAWETGVSSSDPLFFIWGRLLPRLTTELAQQTWGIAQLLAELVGESGSLRRLVIGLLRPTLDVAHLLDVLRLRLEGVRLIEPVVMTRLSVLEAAP